MHTARELLAYIEQKIKEQLKQIQQPEEDNDNSSDDE